jgi:hypothetical protein
VVVDSSSLISLARSGLLHLLDRSLEQLQLLDVVWDEAVTAGKAGQYADAFALETSLGTRSQHSSGPAPTVDQAVLQAAAADGTLLANDLTLGRRARNLGARWLRTADFIVLLRHTGACTLEEARSSVESLWSAGRITESLRNDYLEVLS